jgi:hypothetical protein
MKESEFDERVLYTLRIELSNGKLLLYPIDTENKQYLISRLRLNSDGAYQGDRLSFLWFETTYNRQVIVNTNSIARIIFCFDAAVVVVNHGRYRDNFDVLENENSQDEKLETDADEEMSFSEEEYLPQAIIYHKGSAPEDNYKSNPLLYSSLDEGCLASFDLELDGNDSLRQFINLIDEDGEETFIPLEQIIVMEFDRKLIYTEDEIFEEEDDKED